MVKPENHRLPLLRRELFQGRPDVLAALDISRLSAGRTSWRASESSAGSGLREADR